MVDTSMQDAQKKRQSNKKIDKSMEDAIVNMSPIELAEYFTELKSEGYDDDAIAQLRAKAAENLAVAGTGKASEFMKKVKDKADAAPDPEPEVKEEDPAEEKPKPKKDMYADDKPAKKTPKKKPGKKKKPEPEPAPVEEEPAAAVPVPDPEPEADSEGTESDDESDGPMLLIPDHGDYFVCQAVADGYENVGEMISGPWKTLEEAQNSVERYVAENAEDIITDLYVVEVAKKVAIEQVIKFEVTLK